MHITSCMRTALVVTLVVRIEHRKPSFGLRYGLVGAGRRLRITEQGRSPMGNHDAVWIYDRR